MTAKITLIVDEEKGAVRQAVDELDTIEGISVTEINEERGVFDGAGKLVKWAVGFAGDAGKVADILIKVAEKYFEGSSIKVRFGDREIEVNNVQRDELIETLKAVQEMTSEASAL